MIRFIAGLALGLAAALVTCAVASVAYFFLSGGPLANEWTCSRGEFPVRNAQGGAYCALYGERVKPGETAHPNGPVGEFR